MACANANRSALRGSDGSQTWRALSLHTQVIRARSMTARPAGAITAAPVSLVASTSGATRITSESSRSVGLKLLTRMIGAPSATGEPGCTMPQRMDPGTAQRSSDEPVLAPPGKAGRSRLMRAAWPPALGISRIVPLRLPNNEMPPLDGCTKRQRQLGCIVRFHQHRQRTGLKRLPQVGQSCHRLVRVLPVA